MWKVLVIVVTGCLAVATASVLRQKSKDPQFKNKINFFKDCGSKGGKIKSVDIEPCGTEQPCKFPQGKNVTVKLDFTSEEAISAATTKVHGIIAGIPVSFPLNDPDACHDMDCPVKKGSDVLYTNVIGVKESYPKVRLVVKWEIVAKDDIICFEVPVEIV